MLLLSANDAAIARAVVNGTLVVREAFNARLGVTYWAIEDETGLIEATLTEAAARDRVALLEDVVNAAIFPPTES